MDSGLRVNEQGERKDQRKIEETGGGEKVKNSRLPVRISQWGWRDGSVLKNTDCSS